VQEKPVRFHLIKIHNLGKAEALLRTKEKRNILHTTERRKANSINHILHGNCLLKHVNEGKIEEKMEVMERRGRRRKYKLDDIKETREYTITEKKKKKKALCHTLWRTPFGRVYGRVVKQTME
jgi:ABC-type uncharacterized transport system ATPase component